MEMITRTSMQRINRSKMVVGIVLLFSGITTYVHAQPIGLNRTGEVNEKIHVTLYYRWDKVGIDSTYLSNREAMERIDSLLRFTSARSMDSLHIVAYASPEGNPAYNQLLSQRRAHSFKKLLLEKYGHRMDNDRITILAKGENWEGLRQRVANDPHLLLRDEVLAIIDNSAFSNEQRQKQIEQLDNGRLYKEYMLPVYYRYLRNGVSLVERYHPQMPPSVAHPVSFGSFHRPSFAPTMQVSRPVSRYIRPIAVKTNLLFDLATLFNVEVEVPIGRRFSLLGEWTFPFWGGLGNAGGVAPMPVYSERFTLQMLSAGVEARYWLPRSEGLTRQALRWGDYNALTGWFVGMYGSGGVYDFQLGKQGIQSERFFSAGLTAGYAHPLAKKLHLEYSLGVGYVTTRYYHYTAIDGYKVADIRPDGPYDLRQQSLIGLTKLKVSLVWMPRFNLKK